MEKRGDEARADPPNPRASSSPQFLEPTFLMEALPVGSPEPRRAVAVVTACLAKLRRKRTQESRAAVGSLSSVRRESWTLP